MGESYLAYRDVIVTNNYSGRDTGIQNIDNRLMLLWLSVLGSGLAESIFLFDELRQVVYKNDRWGTFSVERDVSDVDRVFEIIDAHYVDGLLGLELVNDVYATLQPAYFRLSNVMGHTVFFRASAVLDKDMLLGVILIASRNGTEVCGTARRSRKKR